MGGKPRSITTRIIQYYSHDFMPCECVVAKSGGIVSSAPVECTHLDPYAGGTIQRGRVWCRCMTCGMEWRESVLPIRGAGDVIVHPVDTTPYEALYGR